MIFFQYKQMSQRKDIYRIVLIIYYTDFDVVKYNVHLLF